jgi:HK97 family phage portal protein
MSLWFRRQHQPSGEQRAVRLPSWLTSPVPQSYASVDVSSVEASLQSIAVRSAVDLLASLASELPVAVYSGTGRDRRARPMPGYLEDPAGDGHGLPDWCYQALESWMLRGNLYGDVLDVSSTGRPTQTLLHHPDEVSGTLRTDGTVQWMVNGQPIDDPERFVHRRVNPVPGRVQGLSPIAFHAAQLGLTLTATQFGLSWFRDGAHPGGILTNTERNLTPEQAKTAKDRFMAALRGTREPVVMDKGWEFKQVQIAPEDSQFLETQKFSEAQCARIFGPGIAEILGYGSAESMTYANIADRDVHLLKYSLNRWLRRLERLLSEMLPRPQYVRFDRDALLQTATLARYQAYASALDKRWKTVNEVRDDEDLQPVPWGDEPFAAAGAGNQTAGGN